ncbi:hypothetical protein V6N11_013598, partial [Hibiscus sabdariffa]
MSATRSERRKQLEYLRSFSRRTADHSPTVQPMAAAAPQVPYYGEGSAAQINNNDDRGKAARLQRKQSAKQKYGFIPDNFSTLDQ